MKKNMIILLSGVIMICVTSSIIGIYVIEIMEIVRTHENLDISSPEGEEFINSQIPDLEISRNISYILLQVGVIVFTVGLILRRRERKKNQN